MTELEAGICRYYNSNILSWIHFHMNSKMWNTWISNEDDTGNAIAILKGLYVMVGA